jgi:DNA-binding Lrp family transcriptional regulator
MGLDHTVTTRQLDAIDLRILAELQRDGRITFQELSKAVGLSARPCLERVRRLERERIITGYTAYVDVRKLVNVTVVLAQLFVKQGREIRARFEQRMRSTPEVIDCFEVSGRFNYIIKIACSTLADYQDLSESWINDTSLYIERIESNVVLRPAKDLGLYPAELAAPVVRRPKQLTLVGNVKGARRTAFRQVDDIDLRILAALQRDGRITFQQLSEQVGLSARPCLERVRRLERDHIITNYTARLDVRRLANTMVAIVQLHVKQGREIRACFERHICSSPQVLECFEVCGIYDYIAKVACSSVAAYQELTEDWINDNSLHVERVESNIVLRSPKDDGVHPINTLVLDCAEGSDFLSPAPP